MAGLLALIALIAVVVVPVVNGYSIGAGRPGSDAAPALPEPEEVSPTPDVDQPDRATADRTGDAPKSPPSETEADAPGTVPSPPLSAPLEVATAVTDAAWAYPRPGATDGAQGFANPTEFGGARVFRVLDGRSDPTAVQVSLPSMPNGQRGWIPRSEVEISTVEHQILVDLDRRTLTVWRGEDVILQHSVVIGTRWTPTPEGVFYLRDIIRQANPSGSYGPWILALSGFSEVLTTFNGGLPAIAIHGTNNPGAMGQARSNGCVRLPNDVIELLADELPLGTPVTIVAGTHPEPQPFLAMAG